MKGLICLIAVCWSLMVKADIPGTQFNKGLSVGGDVNYMFYSSTFELFKHSHNEHQIHQRLNLEYQFESYFRANMSIRNRLILGGDVEQNPYYSVNLGSDNGYFDLTSNWYSKGNQLGNSQLDRMYIDYKGSDWSVRAGRFRINWVMTTRWNPNNIYNTYSINDFNYEERNGTDGILFTHNLGYASSFDALYTPNRESNQNGYSIRYLGNYSGWDHQLIFGKVKLEWIAAAGFSGYLQGIGIRGEISHFLPIKSKWNGLNIQKSTIASIESDYRFGGNRNWLGNVALLYTSKPEKPESRATDDKMAFTVKPLSYYRYTVYAGLEFDVSSLQRLTLTSTIYDDEAILFSIKTRYSISDDTELTGVIQGVNDNSKSTLSKLKSSSIFIRIKWSF